MSPDLPLSPSIPVWDPNIDDRLVCVSVWDETHDVKTFVFAGPEPRRFVFEPGQFLTFEIPLPTGTVNRCYTLASSPLRPHSVSITVKMVQGGPVSTWLHANLRPGMILRAVGPMGDFTPVRHPAPKALYLSGGSGITPLMAMSRAFADLARPVDIVFLHAARTPRDLVFRAELDLIANRLQGFRVLLLPERPEGELGWPGLTGRIGAEMLRAVVPDLAERDVFCCGPAPFMAQARRLAADLGVPPGRYHEESFDFAAPGVEAPATRAGEIAMAGGGESVAVHAVSFARSGRSIQVRGDQTILAAAREAGLRLPSSCSTGLCGTCKSKLLAGTVDMKHQGGIRQREVDAGLFLPCCSRPLGDLVIDR